MGRHKPIVQSTIKDVPAGVPKKVVSLAQPKQLLNWLISQKVTPDDARATIKELVVMLKQLVPPKHESAQSANLDTGSGMSGQDRRHESP